MTTLINKEVKAMVLDLDGTLLDHECSLTESTVQALTEVSKKNIDIILASGRHHTMMQPYAQVLNLNTPMVCCNGAYTLNSHGELTEDMTGIADDVLHDLMAIFARHGAEVTFFSRNGIYAESRQKYIRLLEEEIRLLPVRSENPIRIEGDRNKLLKDAATIVKILAYCPDTEKAERLREAVRCIEGIHVAMSRSGYFDITPGGTTKGAALETLFHDRRISTDTVVAFGDGENDLEMLQMAGFSVAMEHGSKKLKTIATVVVDNSKPDELAKIIKSLT